MRIRIFDGLIMAYFCFYLAIFFLPQRHISNICGPTAGLLFLLLLRYISGKDSFPGSILIKQLRRISRLSDKKLLFILFAILFTLLSALSIMRHLSFSSGASDLGIFAQAIWNTARGNILFSSLKGNINLLGDHFEPILLLTAPLYMLWPSPLVLLILQSFLLASAIIPLYLIAKIKLNARLLIFALIISYILSRPLRGVGLSDFHPECFILPLLFWGYYFLLTRKNLLLSVTIFFLLLCKEDIALIVSALGIFALFFEKRPKLGASLFVLGLIAWIIETKAVIPFFNPKGVYPYMDRLPFGLTYADNIKSVAANPGLFLRLIADKNKIEYCVKLLGPLGFFPLLSPAHYVLIAAPLIRNILPMDLNFSGHYNISSHYAANIIPFVYVSAIYGAAWLSGKIRHKRPVLLS